MTTDKKNPNPCVTIATTVGALCVGAVAIIGVFAPDQMEVAAWVVGALALMGAILGYLSNKQ